MGGGRETESKTERETKREERRKEKGERKKEKGKGEKEREKVRARTRSRERERWTLENSCLLGFCPATSEPRSSSPLYARAGTGKREARGGGEREGVEGGKGTKGHSLDTNQDFKGDILVCVKKHCQPLVYA